MRLILLLQHQLRYELSLNSAIFAGKVKDSENSIASGDELIAIVARSLDGVSRSDLEIVLGDRMNRRAA